MRTFRSVSPPCDSTQNFLLGSELFSSFTLNSSQRQSLIVSEACPAVPQTPCWYPAKGLGKRLGTKWTKFSHLKWLIVKTDMCSANIRLLALSAGLILAAHCSDYSISIFHLWLKTVLTCVWKRAQFWQESGELRQGRKQICWTCPH